MRKSREVGEEANFDNQSKFIIFVQLCFSVTNVTDKKAQFNTDL